MLPVLTDNEVTGVILVLVGGPIFTQSSNPALRGVTLKVVSAPLLDFDFSITNFYRHTVCQAFRMWLVEFYQVCRDNTTDKKRNVLLFSCN